MFMSKKTIIILSAVVVVVAVLACLLPFPTTYSKTVTAIQMDGNGNEIGKTDISISGWKLNYLLRRNVYLVKMGKFDDITLEINSRECDKDSLGDYYKTTWATVDSTTSKNDDGSIKVGNSTYRTTLYIGDDMDYWAVNLSVNSVIDSYYLFDLSGESSPSELREYWTSNGCDHFFK